MTTDPKIPVASPMRQHNHKPDKITKTLTEGREHAFPPIPGKKNQHDFSAKPTLQAAFMKTETIELGNPSNSIFLENSSQSSDSLWKNTMKFKTHDVTKATATLRAKVKGFWCEMPLNCGAKEPQTPRPPVSSKMIALNEHLNDRSVEKNAG